MADKNKKLISLSYIIMEIIKNKNAKVSALKELLNFCNSLLKNSGDILVDPKDPNMAYSRKEIEDLKKVCEKKIELAGGDSKEVKHSAFDPKSKVSIEPQNVEIVDRIDDEIDSNLDLLSHAKSRSYNELVMAIRDRKRSISEFEALLKTKPQKTSNNTLYFGGTVRNVKLFATKKAIEEAINSDKETINALEKIIKTKGLNKEVKHGYMNRVDFYEAVTKARKNQELQHGFLGNAIGKFKKASDDYAKSSASHAKKKFDDATKQMETLNLNELFSSYSQNISNAINADPFSREAWDAWNSDADNLLAELKTWDNLGAFDGYSSPFKDISTFCAVTGLIQSKFSEFSKAYGIKISKNGTWSASKPRK